MTANIETTRQNQEQATEEVPPYIRRLEDDGSDTSEDEGEIALLGSERRPRRRDSSVRSSVSRIDPDVWEQVKEIVIETVPTLLLTTVGLLFTGELLDHVSHWKAMRRIDELIIVIPVVLNLKGNLEMNLSARLGTASNIGDLDDKESRYGILLGNMALLQVQAALVSFISACLSYLLGSVIPRLDAPSQVMEAAGTAGLHLLSSRNPLGIPKVGPKKPKSELIEFIMVVCTSMSSACLSSLLLGSFMCTLVLFCRKYSLNPDNIAPPIAACLGDLITLCLIGIISTIFISVVNTPIPLITTILLIISSTYCAVLVYRNRFVRDLIGQGWVPLFGAMIISTATGIILDLFVSRYSGFALLAVLISGLPGAVGAIAVSRLSTTLHALAVATLPTVKHHIPRQPNLRLVMVTLFVVTIPIEIIFMATLRSVGWLTLPFLFVIFSLFFFCVTTVISLYFAKYLTNFLWAGGRDPDVYALPVHSSMVDLIGQLLLVFCFQIVSWLGENVEVRTY